VAQVAAFTARIGIDGEAMVVTNESGQLLAYELADGANTWTLPLSSPDAQVRGTLEAGTVVVLDEVERERPLAPRSTRRLRVIDARSGEVRVEARVAGEVGAVHAVGGGGALVTVDGPPLLRGAGRPRTAARPGPRGRPGRAGKGTPVPGGDRSGGELLRRGAVDEERADREDHDDDEGVHDTGAHRDVVDAGRGALVDHAQHPSEDPSEEHEDPVEDDGQRESGGDHDPAHARPGTAHHRGGDPEPA